MSNSPFIDIYVVPELEGGLLDDLIERRARQLKSEGSGRLDAVTTISGEVVGWTTGERNTLTALAAAVPDHSRTTALRGAVSGGADALSRGRGLLGLALGAVVGALQGQANQEATRRRAEDEQQARVRAVQPHVLKLVAKVYTE